MPSFEPTAADFDATYGSRYLSAGDILALGGKKRAKIAEVEMEDLRQDNSSGTRRKFVLYFEQIDKGMVVNQTNASTLRDALGKDPAKWIGTDVGLYVEQVTFGNKRVPGLRLRVLAKPAIPAPATPPPVPIKPAPAEVARELNDDSSGWAPNENWERDDFAA